MSAGVAPARGRPSFSAAVARVFDLSLGELLWSRRTIFVALVVAGPVLLALIARLAGTGAIGLLRINGTTVSGAGIFGMMIWVLVLRFIVPALGVFYGTALIADEVDDKTITYLFTRPIQRGAILIGKFLAYWVCTTCVVLPAVMLAYLVLVPFREMPSSFGALLKDLGILGLGLATYGALFALVGASLKRPLVVGLVFAFGWEPVALLMPGYLKRVTVAYYLQGLVPHAMPPDETMSLFQGVFRDVPPAPTCLFCLGSLLVAALVVGVWTIERREYVLEQ